LLAASGCAANHIHAKPTAVAKPALVDHAAVGDTWSSKSAWREMTWDEYYAQVMRDARRHGAMIIWVNMPELRRVSRSELQPTAADLAPTPGAAH
jgi:hypothetical protein